MSVEDIYPLTPMQEGMLFDALYAPHGAVYVQQLVCRVRGPLDATRLRNAFERLVERHAALRTAFVWEDVEHPVQVVHGGVRAEVEITGDVDLDGFLAADRARGFDLGEPALVRLAVVRVDANEARVVLTHHHLLLDGWSLPILLRDLFLLYAGAALAPSPPFRALLTWLRERRADLETARTELSEAVRGFDEPTPLPFAHVRPEAAVDAGAPHGEVSVLLTRAESDALRDVARAEAVTFATLVDSAWAILLARHAATDDVLFGVVVSGRPPDLAGASETVGMFIDTLPLRVSVAGTVSDVIRRVHLAHGGHARLAHAGLAGVPRFDSVVVVESYPVDASLLSMVPDIAIDDVTTRERTSTKLTLVTTPGERVKVALLFDPRTVAEAPEIHGRFVAILRAIAGGFRGATTALPIAEPYAAPAQTSFQVTGSLADRFFASAHRHADRTAVVSGGERVSYGDLARRASGVAKALRERRVGPSDLVALYMDRNTDLVAGLLGILAAGAAYLPLDPRHPPVRIDKQIADAGAVAVVGTRASASPSAWSDLPVVIPSASLTAEPAPGGAGPDDLAYVLFTSGSTGDPKGVEVTHANVLRLFDATASWLTPGPRDVWTLFHSVAFDFSVWELFGALLHGGTLVVVPSEVTRDPEAFATLLAAEGVTILSQTPSAFDALAALDTGAVRSLRFVIFGGEALRPARLARWFGRHGDAAPRLVNMFGITETTVHVTVRPLEADDSARDVSPIGRPLPDLSCEIRGADGSPVAAGIPGELWVGGGGVARGYRGRPDLTSARFIDGRYRTGDRVVATLDGELLYLGRTDDQVKIRGHRVEPGEVEAVLLGHPGVRAATVVARPDAQGEPRLVAFVVGEVDLRSYASERLPEAMVPSLFVRIDAMPLTSNGKVDRERLVVPSSTPATRTAITDPLVDLVATTWAALLGLDAVDADADVFALGAHSLLATRAASRLGTATGLAVPLRLLFERPSPRLLAEALRGAPAAKADPIPKRATDDAPLSVAQERLWLLDPTGALYLVPAAVRLRGPLDETQLVRAWDALVQRHVSLRTAFAAGRQRPGDPPRLRVVRCTNEQAAKNAAVVEARTPFDLGRGAARATVFTFRDGETEPGEAILLVTLHHIVADGWSLGLLVRDLAALYRGETLPTRDVDALDFATWQRGRAFTEDVAFFRDALAGAPPTLDLPLDRARPLRPTHRGRELPFSLSPAETRSLEAKCRERGVTLFMLLLTALDVLLARASGQDDVSVGVSVAGRDRPETEPMVGFFVDMLVIRAEVAGLSLVELLEQTRRRTLDAFAHRSAPFARVVEAVNPPRILGQPPLFQVNLVYQNLPTYGVDLGALRLEPESIPTTTVRFDLVLTLEEPKGAGLHGTLGYATDLFDDRTAAALLDGYRAILRALVDDDEQPVATVRLPAAPAPHAFDRASARPPGEAIGAGAPLFHRRVGPHARLVHGDLVVEGDELAARVARLAARLAERGVKRGVRVAIILPRGPARAIALLAILRAGAAFVPIEPEEPLVRMTSILEQARVAVIVTDDEVDVPATSATIVAAQEFGDVAHLPPDTVTPDDEAYVLFTSGSTGRPKGVVVGHRGLANLVEAQIHAFGIRSSDRVLQFASFSFDASVSEIGMALGAGATLDLGPQEGLGSLHEVLRDRAISVVTLPPSLLRVTSETLPDLRVVISAGEPCDELLATRWAKGRRFFNAYGPTEGTVCATVHEWIAPSDEAASRHAPDEPVLARRLAIGTPLPGVGAEVCDADGRPLPPGFAGELVLSGIGLAHGYLDAPFGATYRTGDRARRRGDGTLEHLGRFDDQVKVRGQRVELAEVALALEAHPSVREATAALDEDRLVAWVALDGPADDLAAWVTTRLPSAMVPSLVEVVAALPRTSSGKVDRRALPRPVLRPRSRTAPEGATETALAALWSALLGTDDISRDDDFFDVGGHSLVAAELTARIRETFEVELPYRSVFEAPRLRDQAAAIASASPRAPIERCDRTKPLPLSFAQERLWFLDALAPGSTAYLLTSRLELRGALDREALARAFDVVVSRHEALRTRFVPVDGVPTCVIDPKSEPALRVVDEPTPIAPFDLAREAPFRATLRQTAPDRHELTVTVHHVACDATSMEILVSELSRAYRSEPLPPVAIAYVDWAAHERRTLDPESVAFWKNELTDAPPPRAFAPASRSSGAPRVRFDLSRAAVHAAARRAKVTPFMLLLAVFQLALSRRTATRDISVGTPTTGRPHPDIAGLVGLAMNTIVIRTTLTGLRTWGELLGAVRARCVRAFIHQDAPFARVVEALSPERDLDENPLFRAMFTLRDDGRDGARLSLPGVEVVSLSSETEDAKLDLSVAVASKGDALEAIVEHRFERSEGEAFAAELRDLVLAACDAPLETDLETLGSAPNLDGPVLPELLGRTFLSEVLSVDPARVAIDGGPTYGELLGRAREIACAVRGAKRVAVALERGPELVATLLGALLAGAAYLPLSADLAPRRMTAMLAGVDVVVTSRSASWGPVFPRTVLVEDVEGGTFDAVLPSPDADAYVLYTSGSTGEPKGVAVSHESLAHLLSAMSLAIGLGPDDRWLAVTPMTFDIAALELWAPLSVGASIVLATEARDGEALAALARRATVLQATPATFRLLLEADPTALGHLRKICGGEALPPDLATRLLRAGGPLWNAYGPTETTIWSLLHRVTREGDVAIGRALPNTELRIVDGELWIGGVGVARPLGGERPRWHRTGDHVRRLADGTLQWLGRGDRQVKVRGHRIELGEVEAAFAGAEAVVVVQGERLVAFVVGAIRSDLRATLPTWAIPEIVRLEAFPRTIHGKVDHGALARLLADGVDHGRATAPLTDRERAIAAIWSEVLERPVADPSADFFALGGHSLTAARMIARLRSRLGIDLPLRAIFERPQLGAFARESADATPLPPIGPRPPGSPPLASYAAERMWLLAQVDRADPSYHLPAAIRITGALDLGALARAVEAVVRRHEPLRTAFVLSPEGLLAEVRPAATFPLAPEPVSSLADWLSELAREPFDLTTGPPFRVRLGRVREDEHVLAVVVHHAAADAQSMAILGREIRAHYTGTPLPPLSVTYGDYATWQRAHLASRFDEQLAYWRAALQDVTPLALPADRATTGTSPSGRLAVRSLARDSVDRLVSFAAAEGATPFAGLLAAFQLLLARHAATSDVIVGVPVDGRHDVALEPLVGLFVNTLPVRVAAGDAPSPRALVGRTRDALVSALRHADVPFAEIVRAVDPPRDPRRTPLFQAVFLLHEDERPSEGFEPVPIETGASPFELTLALTMREHDVLATLEYRSDLFAPETAERWLARFERIVVELPRSDAPCAALPIDDVPAIFATEPRPCPSAASAPSSIAIIGADGTSLDRRTFEDDVARVAGALEAQGIGRGATVALHLERSPRAIVALFAIWRAGARYLPLDPTWPDARVRALADDAGAGLHVTEQAVGRMTWDEALASAPSVRSEPKDEDDAYVLYTSGSTGTPRGVEVTHGNVRHLSLATRAGFALGAADRVLQFASLAFDASIEEIVPTLEAGATLVLREPGPPGSIHALLAQVERLGVTVLDLPTAFWHAWVAELPDAMPPCVRLLVVGGEAARHDALARFRPTLTRARVTFVNTYGPTEATVTATSWSLGPDDPLPACVPIGRPLPGGRAYVVDDEGRPVPVGIPGELWLGGAGVARGYRHDALENDRFQPDPFAVGGRVVRTGDRARWLTSGEIEFLGRLDRQLKVRGVRIEPGEIEAVLARHPDIDDVAVGLHDGALTAWIATRAPITEDAVKDALRVLLPEPMIPGHCVLLSTLPRGASGKVDRARLPPPARAKAARIPPRDATEASIASIWCDLLGVSEVDVDDDFFALGGHSLLATQLLSRLRVAHGVDLPVRTLFETPTIAGLARAIRADEDALLAELADLTDDEAAALLGDER